MLRYDRALRSSRQQAIKVLHRQLSGDLVLVRLPLNHLV